MNIISDIKVIYKVFGLCKTLAKHDALFLIDDIDSLNIPKSLTYIFKKKNKASKEKNLSNAILEMPNTIQFFVEYLISEFAIKGLTLSPNGFEISDEIKNKFKNINKRAFKTDSISVFHKAKSKSGDDVLIRVLNKNIEEEFFKDIKILYWLATQISKEDSQLNKYNLLKLVREFDIKAQKSIDLRFEAANISNLYDDKIKIPEVLWELSGKNFITLKNYNDYFNLQNAKKYEDDSNYSQNDGMGFVFEAQKSNTPKRKINAEDFKHLLDENGSNKCNRKRNRLGWVSIIVLIFVILLLSNMN